MAKGPGSTPGLGTKTSPVAGHSQKKRKDQFLIYFFTTVLLGQGPRLIFTHPTKCNEKTLWQLREEQAGGPRPGFKSRHHSSRQFSAPRDICCLLGLRVVSFCCLLLQERIQNPSIWRIFKLKFECMALVPWYIRLWNSPSVQYKKAGQIRCPLLCSFVNFLNWSNSEITELNSVI